MDYIEVARMRGEGMYWLIRKEVLPNAAAPLIAEFGLRFCFVLTAQHDWMCLGRDPIFSRGRVLRSTDLTVSSGFR